MAAQFVGGASQMKDEVKGSVEYVCIGAGLPRTGTSSTFIALEKLLPGKCHHMTRALEEYQCKFWVRAERGALSDDDWRQFIKEEKLSASLDHPMSLYWLDLFRMYPNAKVLLTDRDPVKWYKSVCKTIRQQGKLAESWTSLPLRIFARLMGNSMQPALFANNAGTYLGPMYPGGMYGAVDLGQEAAVKFFNDWKAQVIKEVPADRLLVYSVKDGWAPLCKFLGVPQPDEPFPNVNDTEDQLRRLVYLKMAAYLSWCVPIAGVAVAAYCAKRAFKK